MSFVIYIGQKAFDIIKSDNVEAFKQYPIIENDKFTFYAFYTAIETDAIEIVKYMISKKINPLTIEFDAENDEENSPFVFAASSNAIKLIKFFHEKYGFDVNMTDSQECSCLFCAAERGALETAKYLVENGADIEAEGDLRMTPLAIAIRNGNNDVAKYLIEQGANTKAICEIEEGFEYDMVGLAKLFQNDEMVEYIAT